MILLPFYKAQAMILLPIYRVQTIVLLEQNLIFIVINTTIVVFNNVITNVSIRFYKSFVPEKSVQITRLRFVIWKDFSGTHD